MLKEKSFSEKLREWRKAHGWLQKEAADALRVSIDTYRQWEQAAAIPHETPSRREIEQRMEECK